MSSFDTLNFDNRNLYKLPVEGTSSVTQDNTKGSTNLKKTSRIIPNAIFTHTELQPVQNPEIICISPSALNLLNVPYKELEEYDTKEIKLMAQYLSGSKLIPGSNPAAHIYCGHQFGNFAGQLGDGAAMYLGEVVKATSPTSSQQQSTQAAALASGAGEERYEFQLKGAGITPCSRTADGRKVLRSSIREFLCSEAMYYLNIPTTRAGSIVTSDTTVVRDPLYNGNNINEKCTIISRIAPNLFRFGSFEIFKGSEKGSGAENSESDRVGPSAGNEVLKKQLLDHVLLYYPELKQKQQQHQVQSQQQSQSSVSSTQQSSPSLLESEGELYIAFFKDLVKRTAELAAKWQCVGFVHGVLNTDNMSIMGLTIDYGPFAFLEHYDGDFTPNGSDNSGRYTYDNQKEMCKWNLHKLAEVLHPLIPLHTGKAIIDENYDDLYEKEYYSIVSQKLGLTESTNTEVTAAEPAKTASSNSNNITTDESFKTLVTELFESFSDTGADSTDTFQALTDLVIQLYALPVTAVTFTDPTKITNVAKASSNNNHHHHQQETQLTVAEEEIIQSTAEKIASRCSTLEEQLAANKRKLSIHKPGMHPQQLMQLLALLEQRPDDVSEMFGGVPLDALKNELMSEKRKLEKRNKLIMNMSMLQEKLQGNNEAAATTEKKEEDVMSWREWVSKYYNYLKQHHHNNSHQNNSSQSNIINSSGNSNSISYHDSLSNAIKVMQNTNPTFILRNWIAQEAIEAAEKFNDFTKVRTVFNMLKQPFNPVYNVFLYTTAADTSNLMSCNIQQLKLGSNSKKQKNRVLDYEEANSSSSPVIVTTTATSSTKSLYDTSTPLPSVVAAAATVALKPEEREFIKTPPKWANSPICTCSS